MAPTRMAMSRSTPNGFGVDAEGIAAGASPLHRSSSSTAGKFARPSSKTSSPQMVGAGRLALTDFDRSLLPIGVCRTVASRMRLDKATLSPSVLSLRFNNQNLIKEMNQNGGHLISNQFALMRDPFQMTGQFESLNASFSSSQGLSQSLPGRSRGKASPAKSTASSARKMLQASPKASRASAVGDEKYLTAELNDICSKALDLIDGDNGASLKVVFDSVAEPAGFGSFGIRRERLSRALAALGHCHVREADLELMVSLADVRGLLFTHEEFARVVVLSERLRKRRLLEEYRKHDEDQNTRICASELRRLMWDRGYTVTMDTVREILDEIGGEPLDFDGFERAMAIIDERHGFSIKEVQELYDLFDRYDKDQSGELDSCELASGMGFFGTPTSIKHAARIIKAFDRDASSGLSRHEFLYAMRLRLEGEIADIRRLFAKHDARCVGALGKAEMVSLVKEIGYTLTDAAIDELFVDIAGGKEELLFEDAFNVLYALREREGFCTSEVRELEKVFKTHDLRSSGEMRDFELAFAMIWLGYPLAPARRRALWCKIDVDKTEGVSLREFLKLIRLLREDEVEAAETFLAAAEETDDASGKFLRESGLRDMLNRLGYAPPMALFSEALRMSADTNGDGKMDVAGILGMLRFVREGQVVRLRRCAGLPDHLSSKVQHRFGARVGAQKGVSSGEVERFVRDVFRVEEDQTVALRRIGRLVEEHVGEQATTLQPIFWVVRKFCNFQEEATWRRERDAAEAAGFSSAEVAQYRQYFVEADVDGTGELSEKEVREVLDDLLCLNGEQVELLREQLHGLGDNTCAIDFTEFLRLMRAISTGPTNVGM
eukprot:TRINITY_DN31394_c0_g1_i1.p1 TRINITY_DN31394_c0_g1~~TRINITY_DN31394_c0_g1_i1.p1  ORF type:complete len:866 (-),score=223.91 TRINITY_DN31394_c0_g1_i1:117-2618(-)